MEVQVLRPLDIRNANKKTILYWLFQSDGLSQADLVRLTGLRPPSVYRIFEDLQDGNLVSPADATDHEAALHRPGRKAHLFVTNAGAAYAVGIDFWAHSAVLTMVDFRDRPVHNAQIELSPTMSADEVLSALTELIERALGR